jgi:hypothetical protein
MDICRFTILTIQNPVSMSASRSWLPLLANKYVFPFLHTVPGLPQASLRLSTRILRRTSRGFLE